MTDDEVPITTLHEGRQARAADRPVDEPNLATWAWRRATGGAVAILAATTLGLAFGPGGALAAFAGSSALVYVAGPTLAGVERALLRTGVVTPRRLRRTWIATTAGATLLAAAALDGLDLLVLVALPVAGAATWFAVTVGLGIPLRWGRPLAVATPLAVVGAGFMAAVEPTLVDAALILGVLVVVPLAVPLVPGATPGLGLLALAAGAPAAAGLLLTPSDGRLAATLTVPWVIVTAVGALVALARWWVEGAGSRRLAPDLACGYLAVGGLWLLADRLALEPAGFGPPFVQLTAVHFTFAGFVATSLAVRVQLRHPGHRGARLAVAAIASAPPFVALGFVAVGVLQIVGAVLLTVGTYALAWVTLRHVVPAVPRPAAWLLALSSVSVLAPMLLAVQWAVGHNLGTPALSIPAMTTTHGLTNAVGFCLLGVLGWRFALRDEPTAAASEGP